MLLLYITDRSQFTGDENTRQRSLLAKIAEATRCGVNLIQLREKDLSGRALETLAHAACEVIGSLRTENRETATRLLINSRSDIAIACGADGVHLPADDIRPAEVQTIWAKACNPTTRALISVSCHSASDVARAASEGADFALFAPVFEKKNAPSVRPAGIDGLREACRQRIPVLAMGGVTFTNARACLDAGAAGIAAIRLFQENDVAEVVQRLKG